MAILLVLLNGFGLHPHLPGIHDDRDQAGCVLMAGASGHPADHDEHGVSGRDSGGGGQHTDGDLVFHAHGPLADVFLHDGSLPLVRTGCIHLRRIDCAQERIPEGTCIGVDPRPDKDC